MLSAPVALSLWVHFAFSRVELTSTGFLFCFISTRSLTFLVPPGRAGACRSATRSFCASGCWCCARCAGPCLAATPLPRWRATSWDPRCCGDPAPASSSTRPMESTPRSPPWSAASSSSWTTCGTTSTRRHVWNDALRASSRWGTRTTKRGTRGYPTCGHARSLSSFFGLSSHNNKSSYLCASQVLHSTTRAATPGVGCAPCATVNIRVGCASETQPQRKYAMRRAAGGVWAQKWKQPNTQVALTNTLKS